MKTYRNISTIQAEALILLQSLIYGFGDPISKETLIKSAVFDSV